MNVNDYWQKTPSLVKKLLLHRYHIKGSGSLTMYKPSDTYSISFFSPVVLYSVPNTINMPLKHFSYNMYLDITFYLECIVTKPKSIYSSMLSYNYRRNTFV